jgi:hypothetical protein
VRENPPQKAGEEEIAMRLVRRIGLLLALAPLGGAADRGLLELIMPDAHVAFGLSLARLRSSPMGDVLRAGMQNGMRRASGGAELQNLFGQIGFNPFEDIQELIVATNGTGKNPPTLVVMRGSDRLRQLIEMKNSQSKRGSTAFAAFGDVLVTGDAAEVKAARARHGRGPSLNGAMARRIAAMSAKYDLWVISNVPVSSLAANMDRSKSAGMGNLEMLKSIEQFSAGLGFSSDFVLQIEVTARDAASAATLADSAKMLLAMAQQQRAARDPAAMDALQRLQFQVQGRVLRIGMSVPAEEVQKQMQMLQAQMPVPDPSAGPPPVAPKPRPPANTDIVIQSSPKDMGTVKISGSQK